MAPSIWWRCTCLDLSRPWNSRHTVARRTRWRVRPLSYSVLLSHQHTVDANVFTHISRASVSICSTAFQARQHLEVCRRSASKDTCVPPAPEDPFMRPGPQSGTWPPSARKPAIWNVGGLAHVRNRRPTCETETHTRSFVEDCEKLGVKGSQIWVPTRIRIGMNMRIGY